MLIHPFCDHSRVVPPSAKLLDIDGARNDPTRPRGHAATAVNCPRWSAHQSPECTRRT